MGGFACGVEVGDAAKVVLAARPSVGAWNQTPAAGSPPESQKESQNRKIIFRAMADTMDKKRKVEDDEEQNREPKLAKTTRVWSRTWKKCQVQRHRALPG